ncbi:hypothetical protein E2C01_087387 [Portunus trituberculatus]|uniref:Uncharacterized protein n=1 Tax=Portunus trituberculatus TaxID=210409 RepID=A0A5B7JG22_PORTR|nr:hypothetical protein [Portunus trituberculatus]
MLASVGRKRFLTVMSEAYQARHDAAPHSHHHRIPPHATPRPRLTTQNNTNNTNNTSSSSTITTKRRVQEDKRRCKHNLTQQNSKAPID